MASPSQIQNPKSPIPSESFSKAIEALLQWIKSQPKQKKSQLFEPDDFLYLVLTLARVPATGSTNPHRIRILHTLHPFNLESTSICLILDDRPKAPLPPSTALEQIRSRNLPISFVIGLSDLKSDYKPYESRRKLCDSYDLFFADRNILPLLPRFLGKHFFSTKKIPLAVNFGRKGWVEQIKALCDSSLLYLRTGSCLGLKIGRVGMEKDKILENAEKVLEQAMEIVPKKWKNLRSVHLKTVYSVALPVYQKLPEIGMKIESVEDEKYAIRKEERKRARVDKGKQGKKAKKGRIHDGGCFVGEEDVQGDAEVVQEEVAVEDKVKEKDKKRKQSLKGNEEQVELMMNDLIMNGVEEKAKDELELKVKKQHKIGSVKEVKESGDEEVGGERSELSEKKLMKKKEMKLKKKKQNKIGSVKEVKESVDEEDEGEQSELSEKKLKKKKEMKVNSVVPSGGVKKKKEMKVNAVVPSEGVKTGKQKRKGDKFKEEEVGDELGLKGKKKKVKKGGNTMEDVGEEIREIDLSENKEVEENAVVGSDGKKSKVKKPKGNVAKKSKMGKLRTSTD